MTTFAKIDRASSLTTDDKGNSWIRTIHPYDLANYHWAFSSNGREWTVYRDHGMGENHRRERVGIIVQADPAGVVSALRELDKSVTSSMDRS